VLFIALLFIAFHRFYQLAGKYINGFATARPGTAATDLIDPRVCDTSVEVDGVLCLSCSDNLDIRFLGKLL